jgi:hypothetical protein
MAPKFKMDVTTFLSFKIGLFNIFFQISLTLSPGMMIFLTYLCGTTTNTWPTAVEQDWAYQGLVNGEFFLA